MATIANLVARLSTDQTGFVAGMTAAEGSLSGFMTKATLAKAGLAGVGLLAVAIGKHAFDMGVEFDDAMDSIRTKTGATGDELDALGRSVKDVWTSIPANLQDVATTIGALNSQLHLTGDPLETVSRQILELSRITGTDLTGNINAIADAMAKWAIPAAEIPQHLDELFRASQASNTPVSELARLITENAAAFQTLGLTMPESIALVASLEGAGVNTNRAMMGLKQGMIALAEEGFTNGREALEEIIRRIQEAPTDMDAMAIAADLLGARAGPELAAAIRSGKFDLEDMLRIVGDGESTILGTAAATNDFAEKWQILKNKLDAILIPLGTVLLTALTALVDILTPMVDGIVLLADGFDKLPGPVQTAIEKLLLFLNPITQLKMRLDLGQQAIDAIMPVIQSLGDKFSTVATMIGEALALAVDFIIAAKDDAIKFFNAMWLGILIEISKIWDDVKDTFESIKTTIFDKLTSAKTGAIQRVKDMGTGIADALLNIVYKAASGGLDIGRAIVNGIKDGIYAIWDTAVGAASDLASSILGKLEDVLWILSPSKETEYFGKMLGMGLARGMERMEGTVEAASESMANAALKPLGSVGVAGGGTGGMIAAPVVNNYYAVTPEDLQRLLKDSREGAMFANRFASELGLRTGTP